MPHVSQQLPSHFVSYAARTGGVRAETSSLVQSATGGRVRMRFPLAEQPPYLFHVIVFPNARGTVSAIMITAVSLISFVRL